ncbi:MAG: response regulator [Polyangiaceae bacterium]|jgi:CheY-like chemotaxis protein
MGRARVLIIDDDEVVRELMCELMRQGGCEVFDTGSPIGVTKLIAQHQIDIVILDVMMPDISGDKLAKLLRSNPKLHRLTIVLVTSGRHEELAELASHVAADSVVSKSDIRSDLARVALGAQRRRTLSSGRRPGDT